MPYDHSLHFTGHSEQVERYFIWYLEKHSIQIQNYMKGATDCCDIEQYLFTALNTSSQTKKKKQNKASTAHWEDWPGGKTSSATAPKPKH